VAPWCFNAGPIIARRCPSNRVLGEPCPAGVRARWQRKHSVADAASRRYPSECLTLRVKAAGSSSRCQELGSAASGDFAGMHFCFGVIRRRGDTMRAIKRRSIQCIGEICLRKGRHLPARSFYQAE
jgi:hypothetical protein